MSISAYFTSQDPAVFKIYDDAQAQLDLWKADMLVIVKGMGFDDCRAHAFHAPTDFMVKTDSTARSGPVIEGFKGGRLVHGTGGMYFSYTVHGGKPAGKRINKRLSALADQYLQPEQEGGFGWRVRTIKHIICQRLDVFSRVDDGPYLSTTQCHALTFEGGEREIVISVPIEDDDNVYVLPRLANVWTEITGSEYASRLNRHNQLIPKPANGGDDDEDDGNF